MTRHMAGGYRTQQYLRRGCHWNLHSAAADAAVNATEAAMAVDRSVHTVFDRHRSTVITSLHQYSQLVFLETPCESSCICLLSLRFSPSVAC